MVFFSKVLKHDWYKSVVIPWLAKGVATGFVLALFPGLPRFFCSSVSVDGCGTAAKFFATLPHLCIIVNAN